jgi:hypothetical protein
VEALQTDNDWLECNPMATEDALIDQHTLAIEKANIVDKVKATLQEKEGALATTNDEPQKARDALAEAQIVLAQRETTLAEVQTPLQQDQTTLEGARSW